MMALEEYTANHSDTVEEVMYGWSWRRFEGMFKRHLLRKAREELRQMRDLRLAALDANTNFDSQENANAKKSRVEALQGAYQDSIRMLYGVASKTANEVEMEEDPLFSRAGQLRSSASQPLVSQAGMGRELLEATD